MLRQRKGDQRLPDGDTDLVDDQELLIDDIKQRRQLGIERYGQGHRPFNGRDTLEDLYQEQLDLLVYLRSIKRMAESSKDEVVVEIARTLKASSGLKEDVCYAVAERVHDRLQGWIAGIILNGGEV